MSNADTATQDDVAAPSAEAELSAGVSECIRYHTMYAAAGGLIPIPALDVAASLAIQVRMVSKLCDLYDIPFSAQAVKSIIAALVASTLPTGAVGYPMASMVKTIPLVGTALGIATAPALAGAVTWALGRVFAWHFARGGTIETMNPKELAGRFRDELRKGKDAVSRATGSKNAADGEAA